MYELIKERGHESVANEMMEGTDQGDITEENVEVGFFDFDVEPDEQIDKDRDGVAFGGGQKDLRELSESDHEVAVWEFVEETVHLFSNLLLLFLLRSHVAEEGFPSLLQLFGELIYIWLGLWSWISFRFGEWIGVWRSGVLKSMLMVVFDEIILRGFLGDGLIL